MSPKAFLDRLDEISREIARREDRAGTLRHLAASLPSMIRRDTRVQVSPRPDRLESLLSEAVDEERRADVLREEHGDLLVTLGLALSRLPDPRMARLLELRYLAGWPWEDVAGEMCLSLSRIFKLHRQAMSLLPDFPDAPAN